MNLKEDTPVEYWKKIGKPPSPKIPKPNKPQQPKPIKP